MDGGKWALATGVRASGVYSPQGTASASTLRDATIPATGGVTQSLAFGTGSGQANLFVAQDRTLNALTAATYDLYTGTDLKDLAGLTAAFRKLKSVLVYVVSGGDASGVRVGNAAADGTALWFGAATHTALVFPSGPAFQQGSPAGVVVGTLTKNLKVENLGAVAVTIRLMIAGTNA